MIEVKYNPRSKDISALLEMIDLMNALIRRFRCEVKFKKEDELITLTFDGPEKLGTMVLYSIIETCASYHSHNESIMEQIITISYLEQAIQELSISFFPLWLVIELLESQKIPMFTYYDYIYYLTDYSTESVPAKPITPKFPKIEIGDDSIICGIDVCLTYYTWSNIKFRSRKYGHIRESRPGCLLMDWIIDVISEFSPSGGIYNYRSFDSNVATMIFNHRTFNSNVAAMILSFLIKKAKKVQITDQNTIKIPEYRDIFEQEIDRILKWEFPFIDGFYPVQLYIFALLDRQKDEEIKHIIELAINKSTILDIIALFDRCFGENHFPKYYLYTKMLQK